MLTQLSAVSYAISFIAALALVLRHLDRLDQRSRREFAEARATQELVQLGRPELYEQGQSDRVDYPAQPVARQAPPSVEEPGAVEGMENALYSPPVVETPEPDGAVVYTFPEDEDLTSDLLAAPPTTPQTGAFGPSGERLG